MSKGVSPELADEFTICYFPQASSAVKVGIKLTYSTQLGYLCRIEAEEGWESKPIYKEAGWEFQVSLVASPRGQFGLELVQFLTDEHVYFKSDEMRDCDTHIGDVQSAIRDRELEISESVGLASRLATKDLGQFTLWSPRSLSTTTCSARSPVSWRSSMGAPGIATENAEDLTACAVSCPLQRSLDKANGSGHRSPMKMSSRSEPEGILSSKHSSMSTLATTLAS